MYDDNELKNIATKVFNILEKEYNYKESEVFIQVLSQMQGGTEFRVPKILQKVHRTGCAIRFFDNNNLYFACYPLANIINEIKDITNFVRFPFKTNKFEFHDINPTYPVSNIFDKQIAELKEEALFDISRIIVEKDMENKEAILDGTVLLTSEKRLIANSSRKLAFEKATWFDLNLRALYRGASMIATSEKNLTTRKIPLSIDKIVEQLISDTIQRASIKSKVFHENPAVIFSQQAFADILSFAFIPNFSSQNIENIKDISFADNLTIIDDGTIPGLPNSTAFDDEGVQQSETRLIEKGTCVGHLNNVQYAKKGEELTGNSFRVKMFERFPRTYQAYPSVNPSNILIQKGKDNLDELFTEDSESIYIQSIQGQMASDYKNGLFKVVSLESYLVKDGQIQGLLPTFDIQGNIFTILSNNPLFSKETKVIRPTHTPYSFLLPTIKTNDVLVKK